MNARDLATDLIRQFEGCRLHAYRCPAGVWTIGYGETAGIKEGDTWTQQRAESMLRLRVGQFMLAILKRCPELHNEPASRLAACVSLAYNIGIGAFSASSVCRKTRRRDYTGAAESFMLWNKAGGRPLRGLTRRRATERLAYLQNSS